MSLHPPFLPNWGRRRSLSAASHRRRDYPCINRRPQSFTIVVHASSSAVSREMIATRLAAARNIILDIIAPSALLDRPIQSRSAPSHADSSLTSHSEP